jgi:hypothetical protein
MRTVFLPCSKLLTASFCSCLGALTHHTILVSLSLHVAISGCNAFEFMCRQSVIMRRFLTRADALQVLRSLRNSGLSWSSTTDSPTISTEAQAIARCAAEGHVSIAHCNCLDSAVSILFVLSTSRFSHWHLCTIFMGAFRSTKRAHSRSSHLSQ